MARSLIAVVNDDAPFLELMEQLLEEEGYRVLPINEGGKPIKRSRGSGRSSSSWISAWAPQILAGSFWKRSDSTPP